MKKRSALQWAGITLTGLGVALSGSTALANVHVKSHGGLTVIDPCDCTYWFKVGGRLHLDETIFSGDAEDKQTDYPSGGNIRRAILDFNGGVGNCWSYLLRLDFRGNTTRSVFIQDAYLSYNGFPADISIAFGQFQIPGGLENWGSTNDLMFLEPSLSTSTFFWIPDAGHYRTQGMVDISTTPAVTAGPYYAIPKNRGISGFGFYFDWAFCDMFSLALSFTQPPSGSFTTFNPYASDRTTTAGRLTFSPVHHKHCAYHFGVSARSQGYKSILGGVNNREAILSTTPEAVGRTLNSGHSNTASLVNTGFMLAKRGDFYGLEAAGLWGPLTVMGEWNKAVIHRTATESGNVHFDGWYVQAGYVLTGESRCYNWETGTFGSPKPCSPCGAWEVALRYSFVDLNDRNVYGGSEHNASLGINWFYNDLVTFKANYVRARIHPIGGTTAGVIPHSVPVMRRLNIFALRFQVAF